jgi:DNA-binding CsgD family transcriptional regulator
LKSLLAAGDIFFTDSFWDRKELRELHIPRSVYDSVQQRSDLLREEAREMLEWAAVAGRHVDFALLQALTGYPEHELIQCIEPLIAAQLLVETSAGQVAFRHALTQQAVYQGLLARKRQALHLTTAQMMEHLYAPTLEAHLAELAYHFYQAQAWTQALEYARRVGEKALALHAPRAALEHYTHALEAATHLPEVSLIPLYRTRGQAYGHLGNFEVARSDFEQAVGLARATEDRQEEWQSLMGLIWLLSEHDDQVRSDFFQRLLDLAQLLEDPQKYAQSKNLQAHHLAYAGQPEASIPMHEEALHLFQHQGDQRGEARALEFLGQTMAFYGDMRGAVSSYDRAIALSRRIGEKRVCVASLFYRSYATSPALKEPAFSAQGTLAACQQDLEEARSMADEMEWTVGQGFYHLYASWVFTSYGLLGEGFTHARAALQIATEIENPQLMVASCFALGETYLVLLDPSQALAALEAGLAIVLTMGSVYWTGNIRVALARAFLLAGDFPRTEATLEQIIAQDQAPHTILERRVGWVWGELALARHQPDVALRLADALMASAPGEAQRAEGQPIPALLKLRGEALFALGQVEEAIHALEEARRGAQDWGALPLLWQIHRSLGRAYARAMQKPFAHQAFAAAREVIENLAASLDETELRERFLDTALASLPKEHPLTLRQSVTHAFGGLSEREREIALLIAQGKSSREIAEAFSISERTVETHLGRMYAKLGLGTRAQLAAWVVEKRLALPPIS